MEFEKIEETWKGKVKVFVNAHAFRLSVDEKEETYNIYLPIRPDASPEETITHLTTRVISRRENSSGREIIRRETPPPVKKMIAVSAVGIPFVASLLVDGRVHHDKDLPFAPQEGILLFDSGEMRIDKHFKFNESEDNVRVRVHYKLSKQKVH